MRLRENRLERGFSLIELMIVIAIIGILIGVGVPTWKLMVRRGNETAAITTIDTIKKVQADYALGHRGEYATFDQLIKEGSLDNRYAGDHPLSSGYVFTMKIVQKSSGQPSSFSVSADPQLGDGFNATGRRHFYYDPSLSTTRENPDQPATANDPPIGQ
ncbi:MAG TPA: prepilin-type N-terminal cleavage/methylation domain-containing protein [Pyrinomonadaceae bacterium]|nr:prepilin-type N-terminal cleavage/methylation domain-containing protein [Pyrinomonadaceae bacterium]